MIAVAQYGKKQVPISCIIITPSQDAFNQHKQTLHALVYNEVPQVNIAYFQCFSTQDTWNNYRQSYQEEAEVNSAFETVLEKAI